ncbi:peptidase [Veillonella denticariosi JCM 15641]|uniref:Peptidase n=1 Tax=Veillonella denticariosi JCM 15641 TaxID=1298594 RepID=A0A2S7ZD65_9FIRM|nr:PepSY domain-containing protein [Veillonella denticariosi]PQL21226.1 peptidase [Veillonella denticariosi JCM 15641]
MNKKLVSMVLTGVFAVGVLSVAAPNEAQARKTKPETSTDISVQRAPGESMVMTMSRIGTIFQNRFPNAAIHSVELNSNDLNYGYKVVGYSKYHQYKLKIDVITGNVSDMEEGGKPKKVIGEIFNKDKVIEAAQAEAVAKQQLGADAVMKGWKIEAHEGKVLYYVTMHQDGKKVVVTVDAQTGAYVGQGKASKLPPEPDQGFDGRKTNIIWGSGIDLGR